VTSFQRRFASYLEKRFFDSVEENVVPKGETVGLIRVKDATPPAYRLKHNPHLITAPVIGPLNKYEQSLEEPCEEAPILAHPLDESGAEYKVRLPKKSKVDFRKSLTARMSDRQLHTWPWRVIESRRPDGCHAPNYGPDLECLKKPRTFMAKEIIEFENTDILPERESFELTLKTLKTIKE
jgi:hypothetical protein